MFVATLRVSTTKLTTEWSGLAVGREEEVSLSFPKLLLRGKLMDSGFDGLTGNQNNPDLSGYPPSWGEVLEFGAPMSVLVVGT